MTWYNPSTWTVIDMLQGQYGDNSGAQPPSGTPYTGSISYNEDNGLAEIWNGTAYVPLGWVPNTPGGGGLDGTVQGQVLSDNTTKTVTDNTTKTVTDPYAAWGGKAAYDAKVNNYNLQKQGINSTADSAMGTAATGYKRSILDFFDQARQDQTALDQRGINNEMTKTAKLNGILSMVGRGIKSGGVALSNKNAGMSSAAEAIARAYGDIGRREAVTANNEYGLENNNINMDQTNLTNRITKQEERFGEDKTTMVNNIVDAADKELRALDAAMADASMPERIAIEQEKQNIRTRALQALQQHDALIAQNKPTAMGEDARRAEASRLASLGQGDMPEFNYTADVPMGFQGTGPFASELPIFTYGYGSRKKNQA